MSTSEPYKASIRDLLRVPGTEDQFGQGVMDRVLLIYNLLKKTGRTCTYCGRKLDPTMYGKTDTMLGQIAGGWEKEHWIPLDRGGKDEDRNWWPACFMCNRGEGTGKGTMTGREYLAWRKRNGHAVNEAMYARVLGR